MASLTVNFILYASGRQSAAHPSVLPTITKTLSADDDYLIEILPTLEFEEKELSFGFLAACGTAYGSLLSFQPSPQNIPVGDKDIQVAVVYLPQESEAQTVFTNAFNLDQADFSESDFIQQSTDTSKNVSVNESGVVSSESDEKLQALDVIDGIPFSIWKSFPGEATSGNREYVINKSQNGHLIAFYGGNE
ncbi:MAG: hypothetical protein HYZ43_00140 [Flavobacteriia bacterium]|nr:hypothetical protein [Flavobacteriia bacterium]